MINRLIPAAVLLILAFMPGTGGWQVRNAPISRYETIGSGEWISTSRGVKPVDTPVKKRSGEVTSGNAAAPMSKQHQTPAQLWQYLQTLLNQSDFQQIPIIGRIFAERLRKHPDPEVYRNIADLLLQPNVSLEIKAILLDLLAEIATPDSLAQLITLAEQQAHSSLYILVLQAISRIGDNRWDGEFHEELSPALETAWSNAEINDQAFLNAVGKAIAAVGAPNGVDQLLLTVSGSNSDKEPEETNRIKQEVAFDVIPQVRNPDAVEVLSTWLGQEPLGTPASEVSANALAGIGSSAAAQKIVDWAKEAPAEGARNLKDWLSKIDDDNALKSISAAQNQVFRHPEIKAVINSVAARIDSNTALSVTTDGEKNSDVLPSPLLGE